MKQVTVYSTRRVFDGFFKLDEAELSYEHFDGRMSDRVKRLCLERGDSVSAVMYNRNTKMALFVNQFRYPTYNKGPGWTMEAVAGMIDSGESPEQAIVREIREETGYEVDFIEPIATFYLSPGGSTERVFLYYAEISANTSKSGGGGVISEGEDTQIVELSMEELENLLSKNSIIDAKTLIAVQWLLRRVSSANESLK